MTDTEIKEVPTIEEKTMEDNHKALQAIIEALNQDFTKFHAKKVKAAGARVRNNLLNCKKLCDKLRKQIQTEVRSLPVRHRIASDIKNDDEKSSDEEVEKSSDEEKKEVEEVEKPKRKRRANKPKV
jgi:hypothetical protein